MGSTRLPGKILRRIGGRTLLEHILSRLSQMRHQATSVIATTETESDQVVADFCQVRGIHCFRGSESNVLERYYRCAKAYGFSQVVRLTGDNPFTDIQELDRLIDVHLGSHSDFSHSFNSLPVGVGAEVFSIEALEKCYLQSSEAHHFEHVDEYLLENPNIFRTTALEVEEGKRHPDARLTVDTEEDYRRACFIVEHAATQHVSTEEAIALCSRFA